MTITHSTSTLNWDTVFAIPIAEVNRMIREQKSSPKNFELTDSNGNDFKGEFKDWQIITGGDGNSIRMNIPVRDFQTILQDFFIGKFGFQSADLHVQVKLTYLPHETVTKNEGNEQLYGLKMKTKSSGPIDPVVIGISLKNVTGIFYPGSLNHNVFIDLEEILKEIFMSQIITWLTLHLEQFTHTFNVVNLNLYISGDEAWAWCRPSYVDYAYTDIEGDVEKSLLGVLCMTGGRTGGIHQQQKLDAYVIPKSSNAGFLIAEERFLRDVLLPTLPMKFTKSKIDDYEVINASGQAGQYQHILQLKDGRKIELERVQANGSMYTPYLEELKLSLIGDEMKLETYTETHIFDGIKAYCRTTHHYRIVLATNKKGEQTITYEQVKEPTLLQGTINGGSALPWIMLVAGIIASVLLAVFTGGATLLIAGIVVSLIFGTIALLPTIFETLNVETSPSIDLLLENTTSQIIWNASETFELDYAGLAGPLQLGGKFVI
ncbi:toxin [Brevibacillus laterosporus]|uniref:Toxin n=1 Tax=Brevibacillus laterosporus TaxID=1465 RepID=A0A518V441_BRELA|nr:toxin [Brevibacillus laterosporus]